MRARRKLLTTVSLIVSATLVSVTLAAHMASANTYNGYNVVGAILAEYQAIGATNSVLGYPTSNEQPTTCGGGRYNTFDGGAITWTPSVGAHEDHGAIRSTWSALAYECGILGFPTSDETPTQACDPGRYNNFQGGAITWSPTAGAHETYGLIRAEWANIGFECSQVGLPTSGEQATSCAPGGRFNIFELGAITWSPSAGAHVTSGAIRARWAQAGLDCGRYGLPTSDPYSCIAGNIETYCQAFQGGVINSVSRLGAASPTYTTYFYTCTMGVGCFPMSQDSWAVQSTVSLVAECTGSCGGNDRYFYQIAEDDYFMRAPGARNNSVGFHGSEVDQYADGSTARGSHVPNVSGIPGGCIVGGNDLILQCNSWQSADGTYNSPHAEIFGYVASTNNNLGQGGTYYAHVAIF